MTDVLWLLLALALLVIVPVIWSVTDFPAANV